MLSGFSILELHEKMPARRFALSIGSETNLSLVEILSGGRDGLVPLFNTDPTNW
jgi:hypothetical protein